VLLQLELAHLLVLAEQLAHLDLLLAFPLAASMPVVLPDHLLAHLLLVLLVDFDRPFKISPPLLIDFL
jgi:hypothetical protein